MSTQEKANNKYLHVDGLLLDLIIKKPRLSVAKIFNNNRILSEWNFSQPSRSEDFFHLNVLKNSQPKPQICSWRRMGTRFWKPCNLNCRKSWVRCLPASPIRCSTTFHETTFCWIKILYLLSIKSFLELFEFFFCHRVFVTILEMYRQLQLDFYIQLYFDMQTWLESKKKVKLWLSQLDFDLFCVFLSKAFSSSSLMVSKS